MTICVESHFLDKALTCIIETFTPERRTPQRSEANERATRCFTEHRISETPQSSVSRPLLCIVCLMSYNMRQSQVRTTLGRTGWNEGLDSRSETGQTMTSQCLYTYFARHQPITSTIFLLVMGSNLPHDICAPSDPLLLHAMGIP